MQAILKILVTRTSTISHQLSYHYHPFLSPFPPPPCPSTRQRVRYAQILPIVVADNPILSVVFNLLPRFTGDSTMQGVEGKVASNIEKFGNKNKHNISPMIIPLPPVSLNFSTASEYLNSSSSTDLNRLHHQHCNAVAPPPLLKPNPPLPKSETIAATV